MARRKSSASSRTRRASTPSASERRSFIAAFTFAFLALLALSADSSSIAGELVRPALIRFFGEYARFIFPPVVAWLSVGLFLDFFRWNMSRFLGLLLYLWGATSFIGLATSSNIPTWFDTHHFVAGFFGAVPAGFIFLFATAWALTLLFGVGWIRFFGHIGRPVANAALELPQALMSHAAQATSNAIAGSVERIELGIKKKDTKGNASPAHEDRMRELEEEIARIKQESQKKPTKSSETSAVSSVAWETTKNSTAKVATVESRKVAVISGSSPKNSLGTSEDVLLGSTDSVSWEVWNTKLPHVSFPAWEFPPTSLFSPPKLGVTVDPKEVELTSHEIERTLLHFKIEVEMSGQQVGPTVVQYRLRPAEGVKLNRIESLKKDLALALKAKSLRIQAPIPGLGLVGVEVPNERRRTVTIREVFESPAFAKHSSPLALAAGQALNGDYVVADLAKMPHLLIAGQTGSGKSVAMNAFLVSLIVRNSPETLRLILVDPKKVELGIYGGIPHLLAPVIQAADQAVNALKWAVGEMLRRYDLLQHARVRNLAEFNERVPKAERLPAIVIVIDELADLMLSGQKKEVENSIQRLAQMARAVGIHLVLATQRPSVDVITGIIKANVPSRIAFTVASLVDSRTILDRAGAEDLLGMGDMLFSPSGCLSPERVQGVLVTTEEVEAIVEFVKRDISPEMLEDLYDLSIVEWEKLTLPDGSELEGIDEDPKIIQEAINVVRTEGKASTSLLQRRMKLGYSRAARVIDALEELGIVGPATDGGKHREVY